MFLFILRLKGGYTGWFFKRDNFLKKMGDAIVLAEIKKQFSVFIMKMLTKKKKSTCLYHYFPFRYNNFDFFRYIKYSQQFLPKGMVRVTKGEE